MGMTAKQDLPPRPKDESEKWTTRRLFPLKATADALSKLFVSPLEVTFAFIVFILGMAIIFERTVPLLFYVFTIALLAGVVFERFYSSTITVEGKAQEKKKV